MHMHPGGSTFLVRVVIALRSVFLVRCGVTSTAVSFWLRFDRYEKGTRAVKLFTCEADEESKTGRPVSFARLLLYHFIMFANLHAPVYLEALVATAPCPLC